MTKIYDDKKYWRRNWLFSILCLADIQLQKDKWLNNEITNPRGSYIEFMCGYFDDSLVESYRSFLNKKWITEKEYESIRSFHFQLDAYEPPDGNYNHVAILNDKKWQEIVELGQSSVEKLKLLITDPAEKEIFIKRLYAMPLSAGDLSWPSRPS